MCSRATHHSSPRCARTPKARRACCPSRRRCCSPSPRAISSASRRTRAWGGSPRGCSTLSSSFSARTVVCGQPMARLSRWASTPATGRSDCWSPKRHVNCAACARYRSPAPAPTHATDARRVLRECSTRCPTATMPRWSCAASCVHCRKDAACLGSPHAIRACPR